MKVYGRALGSPVFSKEKVQECDTYMNLQTIPPWDALMKRMVWKQLGDIENKTISFANFTGHDNSIILTINNLFPN